MLGVVGGFWLMVLRPLRFGMCQASLVLSMLRPTLTTASMVRLCWRPGLGDIGGLGPVTLGAPASLPEPAVAWLTGRGGAWPPCQGQDLPLLLFLVHVVAAAL